MRVHNNCELPVGIYNIGECLVWVGRRCSARCDVDICDHTQGAEVTGQLRVNGKVRHLRHCTLEDQSLALKRKHRVHKYVNTSIICVSVMKLFILRLVPR